jgi:hypothetical protein
MQYDYQVYPKKAGRLNRASNGQFRIIAVGDQTKEADFWTVPFEAVSHLLLREHLTHDRRWRFHIEQGQFVLYPGGDPIMGPDVKQFYGILPGAP